MDFTNGFEEVDSPILAPRQSAFPPAQPTSTPSTKRRSAPSTASAILDLTDSPPPDPPQKKAKSSKHIETDSLEEWLADPVGLAAPHAKPTAGGAAAGAAPGSRDSASASTSGNRVETSALGEKERGEAGPFATGSSSSSSQPRARGAGTSAFVASSGSNGFAKYANPHSKPQQFLAYPYPSAAAIPAFASGSGSRPANSNGDTSSRSQSTSQQQHPPHQRQSAFASLKQLPQSQAPQSLGRIPIITSASAARVPSAQLASPSSSQSPVTPGLGKNYYRMQSASVSASISASTAAGGRPSSSRQSQFAEPGVDAKGKGREVIDLTADDGGSDGSDDVIVDDAPVCIGQLTSLALILYPVAELQPPPILDANGNLIPRANQHHLPQPLVPQPPLPVHIFRGDKQQGNETLKLISPTRKETFGVMEHRVANVVAPLFGDGWSGTGVTEGGRGKVWCEASVVRRGELNPMMLPLVLLLFARPYDIPLVSDTLERHAIYLEHPPSYNPLMHNGSRYSNPHNPAPGVSGRGGEAERRRQQMMSGMYGGAGLGATRSVKTQDVQREHVNAVFKDLKSGPDLDEVDPPPMVTTKLYPHQKQALSFLLDRERIHEIPAADPPGQPSIVSLWARETDTYGRVKGWKNVVADLEIAGSTPPPQARGSILADDMGLGKTIVVISLVASTLEEARAWALEPIERDKTDSRFDSVAGAGSSDKKKVSLAEFSSRIYGLVDGGGSSLADAPSAPTSKKKQAKAKREKKREDANAARFGRLVTRSRATLIVCPLSTVQNWEAQFEEHTGYADGRAYLVKPKLELVEPVESPVKGKGKGKAKEKDKEKEKAEEKDEEVGEPRAISVYVYHGNSRIMDPVKLANYDVVITTFSTLGTEFSKQARAEEEREEEEEAAAAAALAASRDVSSDEGIEVFGYGPNGEIIESKPGQAVVEGGKGAKKAKRKRKKIEGSGVSPLQQIQWFRVVLDEAHIIKEHTTIQARAACDLSTPRRTALSGTPLQNSLNDLFSLVRFLRLEPFTERGVWTQHIGALAKNGDPLGVDRLQLIMRHLALRRTKESTDKDGKPILALPPVSHKVVPLTFDPAEHAFYSSHHQRYKHDFKKLEETDSVMKNFCSILQELLRLRQICVHMALVKDSEDSAGGGAGDDLIKTIEEHGISKPRGIQLLALMRDAGGGQCSECGQEMLPVGTSTNANDSLAEEKVEKKPARKSRKLVQSTTASAACSDEDAAVANDPKSVITRCQHLFCRACFATNVYAGWPNNVNADDKATCTVCKYELTPAMDAVEIGSREFEKALEAAADEVPQGSKGKKAVKKGGTRLFEHSTKTRALIADLLPFSQANPASANFWGGMDLAEERTEETGGTIGFQPVKGEVVKSVVFSQWTKLLDRLGDALDDQNIKYCRLDGGMNRDQRTRAMDSFKADPACEILLVSLRAGGVGLNLTVARRVYLMEPFWNPAVENQAVDRVYRLGQTMPVQTVRFVIEKSIEENMLKIQKRKMDLANMSLKQTLSKAELAKQRMEDLQILMS